MTMSSWDECLFEYRDRFGHMPSATWPKGLGKNFMTDQVLGYIKVNGHAVEITTGSGFTGERIFGVTVAREHHERPHEADCMCHSLEEVAHVLESIEPSDA